MPPPVAVKLIVEPLQIVGVEVVAVAVAELMLTVVVAVWLQPAALVTVTVYVPAFKDDALVIVGVANADTKPFGPDQA